MAVVSRRRGSALLISGVAALAVVGSTGPAAAASLDAIRIGERPAAVRVTLELGGGALAGPQALEALDASPADGRAIVAIGAPAATVAVPARTSLGVRVRVARRGTGLVVVIDRARRGRFAFVSHSLSADGRRVFIALWKATTARAATIRDDGCLRLARWSSAGGRLRASGRELRPLFEHGLVVTLRAAGRGGASIAQRPVTANAGVPLPDFSGYLAPGRWSTAFGYSVAARRRAMLQAWVRSARDGSLECLVQVPVLLRPR